MGTMPGSPAPVDGVLVAVEVADQAADPGLKGGHAGALGHRHADLADADVDGDVLVEQCGVDAELDVLGNAVRGVVRDDQDPAEARFAQKNPALLHLPTSPVRVE